MGGTADADEFNLEAGVDPRTHLAQLLPFLERYLWPTKPDVTQVLAYVAQACHEYVPPDALESVLLKIAYVTNTPHPLRFLLTREH